MAAVPANAFNNGIKGVIVFRFELVKIKKKSKLINLSWDVLNIYSALARLNF